MTLLRVAIALLVCAVTVAPSRADERADRLVTAFAAICLAKPDSIAAIHKAATAQGFAPEGSSAAALADAEVNKVDPLNLLLFWRTGFAEGRMKLTGLTGGTVERYEVGCWLDGDDVQPDAVLAALTTRLGEPTGRGTKDTLFEATWSVDKARQAIATLRYKPGEGARRVSLSVAQVLGKAAGR